MTTPACGPEPPLLPPDSLSSSSSPLNPPDSLYSPPSQSLSVPPVRRKPLPANNAASSLSLPRRSGLSPPALTPTAGETPEHPRRPPDDRPIPVQPPLSPVSFAPSSSSLVDEAFLSGPRDLVRCVSSLFRGFVLRCPLYPPLPHVYVSFDIFKLLPFSPALFPAWLSRN